MERGDADVIRLKISDGECCIRAFDESTATDETHLSTVFVDLSSSHSLCVALDGACVSYLFSRCLMIDERREERSNAAIAVPSGHATFVTAVDSSPASWVYTSRVHFQLHTRARMHEVYQQSFLSTRR